MAIELVCKVGFPRFDVGRNDSIPGLAIWMEQLPVGNRECKAYHSSSRICKLHEEISTAVPGYGLVKSSSVH
jgi:hypothetical protein